MRVVSALGGTSTIVAHEAWNPTWSPVSNKIAFTPSGNDGPYASFSVVNSDGSGRANYVIDEATDYQDPAWSSDGTRIAFRCTAHATPENEAPADEVCLTSPTGGSMKRLTSSGFGLMFGGPAWSPDATKVLFSQAPSPADQRAELYTVQRDGSGRKKLTDSVINEYNPTWAAMP